MAAYLYDFNGTDTAAGSGVPTPTGNPTLEVVAGSWRRLSNRAHTDTDRGSNPILAVAVGGGDVDLSANVSSGGGDAVYLRVTDAANWIRARIRTYTTSSTYYYTEYEWSGRYTHADSYLYPSPNTYYSYAWSSGGQPYFPSSVDVNHSHDNNGDGTADMWHTSAYSLGTVTQTGASRQSSSTSSTTVYQVIVEKCVGGVTTVLGSANISAPSQLRARAVGSTIQVYVNGSSTAAVTVNDADFTTVGKHGIGRGPSDQNGHALDNLAVDPLNGPPNAPTLNWPTTVDIATTTRFPHTVSDPDAGDSQSKFDLRYRLDGTTTWTTVTVNGPNPYWDAPGGTFAAGLYEGQVRTYDAQGVVGPWSPSSFFTAASAPGAPTITSPSAGGTVDENDSVSWSTPNQETYQVRRVADNAGAPDEATVYADTGEVAGLAGASTRTRALTFDTNNRYEHIQVRVSNEGLWSPWATVRVLVSYTPPAKPVVTLTADDSTGSLYVGIINPDPAIDEPTVTYNEVFIDDGNGFERRATELAPNTGWRYMTPRSGFNYAPRIRVVAVGDNGITRSSL